jgi:predicted PurR-regulated permease PerM
MIERSILVLLVVGLLIGVIAVVKPFTTAILLGAAPATAAWPMRQPLVRRGLGRGSAAALLLILSLVLVVLPLLAFAPHLDQWRRLVAVLHDALRRLGGRSPSSRSTSRSARYAVSLTA